MDFWDGRLVPRTAYAESNKVALNWGHDKFLQCFKIFKRDSVNKMQNKSYNLWKLCFYSTKNWSTWGDTADTWRGIPPLLLFLRILSYFFQIKDFLHTESVLYAVQIMNCFEANLGMLFFFKWNCWMLCFTPGGYVHVPFVHVCVCVCVCEMLLVGLAVIDVLLGLIDAVPRRRPTHVFFMPEHGAAAQLVCALTCVCLVYVCVCVCVWCVCVCVCVCVGGCGCVYSAWCVWQAGSCCLVPQYEHMHTQKPFIGVTVV